MPHLQKRHNWFSAQKLKQEKNQYFDFRQLSKWMSDVQSFIPYLMKSMKEIIIPKLFDNSVSKMP
jgi:hypothetical protein